MLDGLQNVVGGIGEDVKAFATEKPIASALIGAGVVGAGVLTATAIIKRKKKKKARKKTKRITHTKRGWKQDRARRSKQKWEVAYQKRKKKLARSSKKTKKRVGKTYYTKKGQPYKILRSGKAKFIKKSKGRKR